MKDSIGLELANLMHTEDQITILNKYYSDVINGNKSLNEIINFDITFDQNIRYMCVQLFAQFNELVESDLEDRYILGINIRILKHTKIFEILNSKSELVKRIRNKTKDNIFKILKLSDKYETQFSGIVHHFYLASDYEVNFDILLSVDQNKLEIKEVFFSRNEIRIEYMYNNTNCINGQEF
ncbi:MAG: hypothetical protein IPK88_07745 [Saprospiraceae bacterium]|nr:hypothetical protein [Candidatus Defluviibacterium haderslevense]